MANACDLVELFAQEPLIARGAVHGDLDQIVVVAGHQVRFEHFAERREFGVEGVRGLKPRTREAKIQVKRVRLGELIVEAIEYVIDICGEKNVGIGTDFTQGFGREFFDWLTLDKGYARRLTSFGEVINPQGIRTIGEWPNITASMERRGWKASRIESVIGQNWLNTLEAVWGA